MQIQPDYSHQLEEIAKALNRPSMPQRELALIAALVGAVLGMVGQWLMKGIDNRRDIGKMRRVLVLDLLRIFQRIDDAIRLCARAGPNSQFWIQLKRDMKFDGETFLKGHLFMQLPGRQAAERLYGLYHRILDESESVADNNWEWWWSSSGIGFHQWVVVKMLLANFVKRDELQRRYMEKSLGSAEAEELIKKIHGIAELRRKSRSETTEPMDGK